jgi:RES domain-containing protein
MPLPQSWDAATVRKAVAALPFMAWRGRVWRVHRHKYAAIDPAGSLIVSGRYNQGGDDFPPGQRWPALYTSTAPDVALAEAWRYIDPDLIDAIKGSRRTEIAVDLSLILDCRDVAALGLAADVLLADWNYDVGHLLGWVVVDRGAEAMLVPSATRLGDNLIVFTTNMRQGARLDIVRFQPLTHLRKQAP